MSELSEQAYHDLLHDLKNFVIDLQNVKHKVEELTADERIERLEARVNALMLENAKLKLLLEDVCHQVSMEYKPTPKTRRKS